MLPVLFPHTLMTESLIEGLQQFFQQITVLQASDARMPAAMIQWEAEAAIHILRPAPDNGEISTALQAFRLWRQQHQGGDVSIYRYMEENVPFFSAASVSQIKKEIRTRPLAKPEHESKAGGDAAARLFQARLFLQMAQEFDVQNHEIAQNLAEQVQLEQGLFSRLKGNGAEPTSKESETLGAEFAKDDPFGYMLRDRLQAWARVMLSLKTEAAVFITSRRDVVEMLFSDLLTIDAGVQRQAISVFDGSADAVAEKKQQLLAYTQELAQTPMADVSPDAAVAPWMKPAEEASHLELYTIQNLTPVDFLGRLSGKTAAVTKASDRTAALRHTII